jgi:beta-glucosidase-like glycosyl hydrolase
VEASAAALRASDLLPFTVAIESGVASIMTAHVAYPNLDASGLPATLSRTLLGELRARSRFDGLVVTDALIMDGALKGRRESDAAVEAIQAGADLLLYPNDPRRVRDALATALSSGTLTRERLDESLDRYQRALTAASAPTPPVTRGPFESADALADALLSNGMVRGSAPKLTGPLDPVVVDDDIGGPFPPGPSDYAQRALGPEFIGRYSGGSRVVLVFAEPRGWKGRSGLGSASREALAHHASAADLVVLFGHPRLLDEIPLRERGEDQDGGETLTRDVARRGQTVEPRHLDVEDRQVHGLLGQRLERGGPVAVGAHLVAFGLQSHAERREDVPLVVDQCD